MLSPLRKHVSFPTVAYILSVTCCHFLPSLLDDVFTCEELESIKKAKKWGVFYRCEEYA